MQLDLTEIGPTLTARELYEFEEAIGCALPSDYRAFVTKTNGGRPKQPIGFRLNDELIEIDHFYGVSWGEYPHENDWAWTYYRELVDLGHVGYLPISSAFHVDMVCIDLHDEAMPLYHVVYEYDKIFLHQVVEVHFQRIADCFTDLISRLVEIPVEYCRIEELAEKGTPADLEAYLAEGNSIDARGKHDQPLLLRTISRENTPLFDACLANGASLSLALHRAAMFDIEVLRKLLEAGADPNERNSFGTKPISFVPGIALPNGEGEKNQAKRDLLLEYGAVEDVPTRD